MKKQYLIIGGVSLVVVSVLYLSYKKATQKDITNDAELKNDYQSLMKKIQDAKK